MPDQTPIRYRKLAWYSVPVVLAIAMAVFWPRAHADRSGLYYCAVTHSVTAPGQTTLECSRDRRSPSDRPVMVQAN